MVTFHLAATAPVNPPGSTVILTQAQLFAGFQQKIRAPWKFVPAIESAEVLSDEGTVVKRRVTFKPTSASDSSKQVIEVCTEYAPSRVDYQIDDGSSVLNIISDGPTGAPNDLYITYVFVWKNENIKAGSAAADEAEATYKRIAKIAVESTLTTTRKLVTNGEIH